MKVTASVLVYTLAILLSLLLSSQGYNYGGSLFLSRDENQNRQPVGLSGLGSFWQIIGVSFYVIISYLLGGQKHLRSTFLPNYHRKASINEYSNSI